MPRLIPAVLLLAIVAAGALAAPPDVPRKTALTTDAERIGYAIGLSVGETLVMVQEHVDMNMLWQAIEDVFAGNTLLTSEEAKQITLDFRKIRLEALERQHQEKIARAAAAGQAFQAENADRPGVVVTASGLQYEVLAPGNGPMPGPADQVVVHYRGTLVDGTEFDSSYARADPEIFSVSKVIPGWIEALTMMPVGSKWRLVVPPELAYADKGFKDVIGPKETLVFELELLEIR